MDMTVSEIPVDFRGEGAGTAELTWGQLRVWRTARQTGRTMNLVTTVPLPEGTSLDEMVALLRFGVSRHPALRTRLRFADRPSGPQHPWQVVSESGEVPLQIVDIADADPVAAAEELRSRYELTWFDYEHEFPVRMGIVRQSGALRVMVIGFSHVMVDGAGLAALSRDTAQLDRATGTATAPSGVLDLLELARVQHGPDRPADACVTGKHSSGGLPLGITTSAPTRASRDSGNSWRTLPRWSLDCGLSRPAPKSPARTCCSPPTGWPWRESWAATLALPRSL
jgi:hypothetical protein